MASNTAEVGTDVPSDEQLVDGIRRGDRAAFGSFYDRYSSRVFGLVRRLLIDSAQSEEVTQEIFLEVWQSAARFDPNKGRVSTWVMTMTHRRAVDRIRAAQSSHDRDLRIGVRDMAREYDQVAEAVEIRMENARVESAMAKLSDVQRSTIELAYFGGLSQSEIAEKTNTPLGTVKTRLRDALLKLREELGVTA